jgi:Flp pilus assembly protein TadG
MHRRFRSFSGLMRSRSGNTIVEFAIVVPVLLTLFIFLVEGSIQLLTAGVLQYGLREATRFGTTGQAYPPNMAANPPASRTVAITQIIAEFGLGLINQSLLSVTLTNYTAFTAVGTPALGSAGPGGPGAVVQYQVTYYQPWLFRGAAYPAALATGLSGIQHNLTMVVQNELFPTN